MTQLKLPRLFAISALVFAGAAGSAFADPAGDPGRAPDVVDPATGTETMDPATDPALDPSASQTTDVPEPAMPIDSTTESATTDYTATQYQYEDDDDDDDRLGLAASVGGGLMGFTDDSLDDMTDTGGAWTARLTLGTRSFLAAEVGYSGSAQNVSTLGLDDEAVLMSHGLEGLARVNILDRTMFQPYVFAGAGWRHYSLVNENFNTSSVRESDDVVEIPVGAGLAFRFGGLIADARFDVRPSFDNDLVNPASAAGDDEFELHNWSTTVRVGWEF